MSRKKDRVWKADIKTMLRAQNVQYPSEANLTGSRQTTAASDSKGPILTWEDELGPAKVLYLYDPHCGLKAIVVLDNVARGPALGGVRMAPDVTPYEVFRLARAMTLKSAAAGLPLGGGKAGIVADPSAGNREALLRSFARGIAELSDYIPAPDMGTDEGSMAIIYQEIGRAAGLPRSLGGIPLDEIGATGFGLCECAEVAAEYIGLNLKGARLSVEGFGHVGEHAARFLAHKGSVLVVASDIQGLVFDPNGLDLIALARAKREGGTVLAYDRGGRKLAKEEIFSLPCDIFIPAARPGTLHRDNALKLRSRLLLQGANIPVTIEAERILHDRGILVIPDLIANAGGLICCSVEYQGGNEETVFATIKEKISKNTETLLERLSEKVLPRDAAMRLALERLGETMGSRERALFDAKTKESFHDLTGGDR